MGTEVSENPGDSLAWRDRWPRQAKYHATAKGMAARKKARQNYRQRIKGSPRQRFFAHKENAHSNGVEFLLTFEQWWELWEPYWPLRGVGIGKYNMARHGDIGPYAVGNVSVILATQNVSDMRKRISESKNR